MTAAVGGLLPWAGLDVQGEAAAGIRKLEEGLRLEKDVWVSTDQVGEQDNESDSLVHHFAKLRGSKPLWVKVWVLVTKPD